MSDPSRDFFNRVNEQGFDARLGRARGTLRFDVDDGGPVEHWLVSLDRGGIQVSRAADEAADCVVRLDRATLDGIVTGDVNLTASMLRGGIAATGNLDLLLYLQRLFPAGPHAQDRNQTVVAGRHDG
jgi:putative sterol carrier protein